MSIESVFGNFFKPEIKSSGAKLVSQEKISLSGGSDLAVGAFVRSAPPYRVQLTAVTIDSKTILAACTCPIGKKAQFCKHVWAALICAEQKFPDFFIGKTEIEKITSLDDSEVDGSNSYQEAAKLRANEYRKAQYEKQKARVKEMKKEKNGREKKAAATRYTPEVEAAIAYFALNGFPMEPGFSEVELGEGKRKLSRVLHPDRGGSHEEIVELNNNWEILIRYLRD